MRTDKVIYFTETSFNRRDYQRFGVEYLIEHNINVEVWEFTSYLNPCLNKKYSPPDPIFCSVHKVISSKKEYIKKLNSLTGKEVVMCLLGFSFKHHAIYYQLSKRKILYGVQCLGILPKPETFNFIELSTWNEYKVFVHKFCNLEKVRNQLIWHFPNIFGIKAPDFYFVVGQKFLQHKLYPISKKTSIVQAHKLDYDLFLKAKEENVKPIFEREYVLFLDEFGPFHPDYIIENKEPACGTAENYYPNLNRFFSHVERTLGIPVIIAAHPTSNYENMPDYFDDRKVIRGFTVELVKHAKLILAHASTSLNFAILFNKPVIFLSQDSYKTQYKNYISMFASLFGSSIIQLSSDFPINFNDLLKINYDKYFEYREEWIKSSDSGNKKFFIEIFIEYIQGLSTANE